MLEDVVAAALELGDVTVVTGEAVVPRGATRLEDPGGGQSAAVGAALRLLTGPVLVVNADLPFATPDALRRLGASGNALVAARDGTTNALSLLEPDGFVPRYGPGSAARHLAAGLSPAAIPELAHDVDTLADLDGVALPLGPATRRVLDRYAAAHAATE
jgi:2-phospho-L-lactate guanylyltransferase